MILKGILFTWNYLTVYDAGHDALGIYEYLVDAEITPVIALNPRSSEHPLPTGTAKQVSGEGIPLCPAGIPMRRISHNAKRLSTYYNCPVKREVHHGDTRFRVSIGHPLPTIYEDGTRRLRQNQ